MSQYSCRLVFIALILVCPAQFSSACLTFRIPGITVDTALGLSANFSAAVGKSFPAEPIVSFTLATRFTVLSPNDRTVLGREPPRS